MIQIWYNYINILYYTCIIHPKKASVVKKIKLNQKWEKDYFDKHVRHSGCKADEGQRTIYNWFWPVEEEEEYDSDIYDNKYNNRQNNEKLHDI